ncbi:hypothetical protein OGAPHI_005755 [Ogataea philodendri]|uniref:N-alpha-acetyltransferase 30 n=1 Tax=Ogataea philodendri TaxID=1378263 RepID=A0A9P8NYZ9_9ASCO|nr:uncharacterized protein OGAPHI_005755 [Ogataea philodendri]KAH3662503.1 hypothetical protein OGAPHI_005755 [Ogataea philodendri]
MSGIDYEPLSLDISEVGRELVDFNIEQVRRLVDEHLSEPYSIYVYRFFLNNWPNLTIMAKHQGKVIGCIISKVEPHRDSRIRGYIGMLAVDNEYRGQGIAKELISRSLDSMIDNYKCDEIILETEVVNKAALRLYENFGFLRVKRLFRYYLNKHDALRLILPVSEKSTIRSTFLPKLENSMESKY